MDDRTNPGRRGKGGARCDDDLYGWAVEPAALLRAGKIAEADALNVAAGLDDVGNERYDKLERALRLSLLPLLEWDHQVERRSRGWYAGIKVERNHVRKVLRKNPGLKPLINEAVTEAYDDARIEAAGETDLDENSFPTLCPCSWDGIMERPIDWPPTA